MTNIKKIHYTYVTLKLLVAVKNCKKNSLDKKKTDKIKILK